MINYFQIVRVSRRPRGGSPRRQQVLGPRHQHRVRPHGRRPRRRLPQPQYVFLFLPSSSSRFSAQPTTTTTHYTITHQTTGSVDPLAYAHAHHCHQCVSRTGSLDFSEDDPIKIVAVTSAPSASTSRHRCYEKATSCLPNRVFGPPSPPYISESGSSTSGHDCGPRLGVLLRPRFPSAPATTPTMGQRGQLFIHSQSARYACTIDDR